MKGIIVCAGKGTRLYPFTHRYPKTLLPVGNIPLLHTCIENLAEQEIDEIGIVLSPAQQPLIARHTAIAAKLGVKLTSIYQEAPLGIADAVKQAEHFIDGDSFLLLLGDNLITDSLSRLKTLLHAEGSSAAVLLKRVEHSHEYGIAEVEDCRIVGLEEKPLHPKTNLAVMGAYAFAPVIFAAIADISPSSRGEYEITDAIQWLIQRNYPVTYQLTEKPIFDVGTVGRWLEANRWQLDHLHTNQIHATAVLENCKIIPPVNIARGCRIKDCIIGPYVSVGVGACIQECQLENSIIMDQVHLTKAPFAITNTVVGYRSSIVGMHR
ncbi:sugar phosphate nucleotidyltransferase [Paenibacillus xerothermodurans]|uniref:Nucleotidyl transferase n=1 Tax=Paenibacillus xerothermodurans TaxID=1977292 RepID=A0A2W1NQ83_PAEXE|nr:sugar phosphate nucleotidyltransferase [Paenibacillus xerothermodurans]PZE21645.1 nucleotidyl transferase [Paenibacillus xerothermodurans]